MKYILLAFAICFLIPACKKDKTKDPTKTELITSSSWKYESGGIDQNRDGTVDLTFESTGYLQPCILDNFGTFNVNGTGVSDEGPTKCTTTAPQTTSFTWNFLSNETMININGSGLFGLGGQFKILELSSTKFRISKDTSFSLIPAAPPITVGLIVNLKH